MQQAIKLVNIKNIDEVTENIFNGLSCFIEIGIKV